VERRASVCNSTVLTGSIISIKDRLTPHVVLSRLPPIVGLIIASEPTIQIANELHPPFVSNITANRDKTASLVHHMYVCTLARHIKLSN